MNLFSLFDAQPSQNDIAKAQMKSQQIPLEIGASKFKFGLIFAISVWLLIYSVNKPPPFGIGWLFVPAIFAAYMLSPLGAKLTLTHQGFEAKLVFNKISKNWVEIDDLRAIHIARSQYITWKDARDPMVEKPEGFFVKLFGYKGTFTNIFAISTKELLALMQILKMQSASGYYRPNAANEIATFQDQAWALTSGQSSPPRQNQNYASYLANNQFPDKLNSNGFGQTRSFGRRIK